VWRELQHIPITQSAAANGNGTMATRMSLRRTPAALLERDLSGSGIRLDENGNPDYRLNPLLSDLPAHLRMMDRAGIDAAVLSCGLGFDQPDIGICRGINDSMHKAELDWPGRFIGLAHVPALDGPAAADELRRCAAEFGFPGVVIASEIQGRMLDDEAFRPFWRAAAALDFYVFIHPLPKVIAWRAMDADDLGRMLGWEFSLIVAAVRLVNCGLLDELPALRIQLAHFLPASVTSFRVPAIALIVDREER
jgi:predicted TIM-barrel fold metal-dependent hydrolase